MVYLKHPKTNGLGQFAASQIKDKLQHMVWGHLQHPKTNGFGQSAATSIIQFWASYNILKQMVFGNLQNPETNGFGQFTAF